MDLISGKWLLLLGCAATWSVLFSMFDAPQVRGWRNLGLLACYVLGAVMAFVLPWPVALATWGLVGISSGLLYVAYELFAFVMSADRSQASRPNPMVVVHGLVLWPIMLPECIEYWLADLGVLKEPVVPGRSERS